MIEPLQTYEIDIRNTRLLQMALRSLEKSIKKSHEELSFADYLDSLDFISAMIN